MSHKQASQQQILTRTARQLTLAASVVAGLLLVHAVLGDIYRWSANYFDLHVGLTVFLGVAAIVCGCTSRVLAEIANQSTAWKRKAVTKDDMRRLAKGAFQDGQLAGIASGVTDLHRGA